MGIGQKVLLSSAVITLILGFMLYSPLHPDTDEPFKVRCYFAIFKMGKYMGDIGELFGYHPFVTQRILADTVAEIMQEPLSNGIVTKTSVFNGVNVRIFEPESRSKKPRAALIFIHGGWFAIGSSAVYFDMTDLLAYYLDTVVISVDYRLAPEHPFPAGFDDCHTVVMYVFNNAKQLHINPRDVGIAGDSAGGALAAAVAQKLRDDGGKPQFRYQVLIYPVTQALTIDLPSHHTNEWYNQPQLRRPSIAEAILTYIGENRSSVPIILDGNHTTGDIWQKYGHLVSLDNLHLDIPQSEFMQHYGIKDRTGIKESSKHAGISHEALRKLIHPYAYPLMAESMKNLPPALVITCESDTLRDDGFLYTQRLRADGVKVLHHHKRDSSHGYISFVKAPLWLGTARRTIEDIATFVEKI